MKDLHTYPSIEISKFGDRRTAICEKTQKDTLQISTGKEWLCLHCDKESYL